MYVCANYDKYVIIFLNQAGVEYVCCGVVPTSLVKPQMEQLIRDVIPIMHSPTRRDNPRSVGHSSTCLNVLILPVQPSQ